MFDDNCIFCKIAAGIIPSATVYEDDDFRAILDIAPAHKGHTILLPKYHAKNIFEIPDEIAMKALPVVKKVSKAIMQETGCDGINVLQNNGTAAGQSVFHLHIHMVPRFDGDGILPVWSQTSYDEGEAAVLAGKINSRL
ncbi:MAG: HIT family protein [Clostridiales bacterium]|nr:HIT family protein [Clostridiales bacterium]